MSMASNYNSRPRAAEVLVDKNEIHLVRDRESINGIMAENGFLIGFDRNILCRIFDF